MPELVKLYVYDLSNGLARQLSQQLTGKLIEGIWHTSVVVFGKEIFYGQGINITPPGRSHHGNPQRIVDMGETAIDPETFEEYLNEMREHYTADKYHLLDFNCNSFTNDCVGFLTGGSIPDFIKDLPSDFLSTPFGAALRPTIDNMYRRPMPGAPAPALPPNELAANPQLTASLLQAVAAQAHSQTTVTSSSSTSTPVAAVQSLTAPVHLSTNPASFHSLLRTHRAVVAFFTSATCPPCRVIEPVFEQLASEKGIKSGPSKPSGAAFTKVDLGAGLASSIAGEYGVRVTPTFLFFLDGKKTTEMKGANANELRTQIDLLLYEAYPPHPHTTLSLPAVDAISLNPILFSQVPPLDTVVVKLTSLLDTIQSSSSPPGWSPGTAKELLSRTVLPYLKARFPSPPPPKAVTGRASAPPEMLSRLAEETQIIFQISPPLSFFPLVDLWRLLVLDPNVGAKCSGLRTNPLLVILDQSTADKLDVAGNSRPFILTSLRLFTNVFSSSSAAKTLLSERGKLTSLLISGLLHEDAAVRTAAASLAFNVAAFTQKNAQGTANFDVDEDWQVELVSVIVEAIDRETANEEVVHRLTAALALILRLSPFYETQLSSLLEVIQARSVLERKLEQGLCGDNATVKNLVKEVAMKLCPAAT